jgi:MGT family glycosyltransferase
VLRDLNVYLDAIIARNGWQPFSVIVRPTGSRYLNLMQSPISLEYPIGDLDPTTHFVGPLLPPTPADFAPPPWWDRVVNAAKPVVLVTQGTIAVNPEELLIPSLEALKDLDVLVIGTTGGKTAEALGLRVPDNAIVTPFIPFAYLMPHVDVMVTNGGFGGVNIALAHGVPLVAGGITEDKTEVNNRVAYAGVGVNLKTATPTPDQIRAGVERVLGDHDFARKAARIQAEIAASDAANMSADLLERLAKERRPLAWALPEALRARGWGQRRAG